MSEILKVSSKSNPNSVAGALAGVVRGSGAVEIQVVGAGALNQAVKAVAIARSFVAASGIDLTCRPTFADIEIDGEGRTAIRLLVEECTPNTATGASTGHMGNGHSGNGHSGNGHSGNGHAADAHVTNAPSPA